MSQLERVAIAFRDVPDMWIIDSAGNIRSVSLLQYAAMSAHELRGCHVSLTVNGAARIAQRVRS